MKDLGDCFSSLAALLGAAGAVLASITALVREIRKSKESKVPLSGTPKVSLIRTPAFGIGILLVLLSVVFFAVGLGTRALSPINVRLTKAAWDKFNSGRYTEAITIAGECIDTFEGQALQEQREFTASGSPTPPVGPVSNDEYNEITSRGVLNDVATCYFIKGRALEELNRISEAKEAYMGAQQFPDARTWDPAIPGFWSPAQTASSRLATLP